LYSLYAWLTTVISHLFIEVTLTFM